MSITVKILDCDENCQSCYERKIRKNYTKKVNKKKILETMRREFEHYKQATIHGGEPLILGFSDFLDFLSEIFKKYGHSGIQTNLRHMKRRHVQYFKKYKTNVGISLDGDDFSMNLGRGYDPERVLKNMRILKAEDIRMSAIIILRKYNAEPQKMNEFIKFLKRLKNEFGITDIRCNPGISYDDKIRLREELKPAELGQAYIKIYEFMMQNSGYSIQPIRDFVDGMMGHLDMSCAHNSCDPYFTTAETTIMHDGSIGCCLKSGPALDGIAALRDKKKEYVRDEILSQTDCKDCKFWYLCHGGCPGAGIGNDWRNKTRFCDGYKMIFNHIYKKIKNLFPNVYLTPDFYPDTGDPVKSISGSTWQQNKRKKIEDVKKDSKKCKIVDGHGDQHFDSHGDRPHGDSNDPRWRKEHKWK